MAWIDNYFVSKTYAEGLKLSAVGGITVPSGLSNSMMVAVVSGRSTDTNPCRINGFSWQSSAFSSFVYHDEYDYNSEGEMYVWYLLNPAAAGPASVSISYNTTRDHDTLADIYVLKNVVQQAPQSWVAANGTGTTRTNSGISCSIGDLLVCFTAGYGSNGGYTLGSNQTLIRNQYYANKQASFHLTSWKQAASVSESMQHSWVTTRDHRQGSFAISTLAAESSKMILVMNSIYDRIQENRKKLGIGDLEGFKRGRNGLWKPQSGLVTI